MNTTQNIDTKIHTKTVIGTRTTEDGQTIDLVKATPRTGFPRASVFYEERCEGKVIAFDGGGVILRDWEANGWIKPHVHRLALGSISECYYCGACMCP